MRRRPAKSINTSWALVMRAKPSTKGTVQSRRLSFRPARSSIQPPSMPPAAAPRVTMACGQGHGGLSEEGVRGATPAHPTLQGWGGLCVCGVMMDLEQGCRRGGRDKNEG